MKKIKINILVSFICLLFANSLFAQVNPHDRMIKRMKESGLTSKEIEKEIKEMDAFYQKHMDEEFQRIQDEITKSQKTNEAQRAAACTDIPASEKLVLRDIYDNLNGVAWATNWDFNTPVTSWNPTSQTGWYGVTLDENCSIQSLFFDNVNIEGDMQDLSSLSNLEILWIRPNSSSNQYQITGDFSSIGYLVKLKQLHLKQCDFNYNLPNSFVNLSDTLLYLTLEGCNLNNFSDLCTILTGFNLLLDLNMDFNQFSGSLPSCINPVNLPSLASISFRSNLITNIDILTNFTSLVYIIFTNNDISGNLQDFSANVNLTHLLLGFNNLEGNLPLNYFDNIYTFDITNNNLKGEVPLYGISPSWQILHYRVYRNQFVFKDLENIYNNYNGNNNVNLQYAPQAKTDTVINETINQGSSYTMTMHTDGNHSSVEEYQWYKGVYPNGVVIAGANSRQYILSPVSQTDAGSYYCLSTHPSITIPSNPNKNLVLQREQINLNVVNCEPISGSIDIVGRVEHYLCGDFWSANFGFNSSSIISEYNWIVKSPTGNVIHTSTNESSGYINFSGYGVFTIEFEVTTPDGCIHNFSRQVELVECEPESCTKDNPNSQVIKQLFINLLNHLKAQTSVPNGYTCPELTALAPYITDSDPKIYGFSNTSSTTQFWFHPVQGKDTPDVLLQKWSNVYPDVLDIGLSNYQDASLITDLNGLVKLVDDSVVERSHVRHIDFCPKELVSCTLKNPNSQVVQGLLIDLVHELIQLKLSGVPNSSIEGTIPSSLVPLIPYITDANPRIWGFNYSSNSISFSFSKEHKPDVVFESFNNNFNNANATNFQLDLSSYSNPDVGVYLVGYQYNDFYVKELLVKHVNFCPDETVSCTVTNPNSQVVKQLFINLVNHLKTQTSVPNGYTCPELTALAPYISDPNPKIYNFINDGTASGFTQGELSFSFSNEHEHDVNIYFKSVTDFANISLDNYVDDNSYFTFITTYQDNSTLGQGKHFIKHINFCPEESVSCTATNPNTPQIQKLLLNLLSHLIQRKLNGDSDASINGSVPPQLTVLAPYITDADPVSIHNFVSTYTTAGFAGFSFSFSPNHGPDISIGGGNFHNINSSNFQFDLSNYNDAGQGIIIDNYIYGNQLIKNGFIKHIEFCPDELYCKHHVAIVVDESGSIDFSEREYIKKQLKSFVDKQYEDNTTLGTNMYVSLIGLSDNDIDNRDALGSYFEGKNITDLKVDVSNISFFHDWIDGYRTGRVTPNADYWKSGLEVALEIEEVELVILITDGSQTSNPESLKETVRKFNNNNGGNGNSNAPHLYVIGMDNGFYVDNPDSEASVYNKMSNEQNPNFNPELTRVSETGRVSSFLRKSLKYLMEFLDDPDDLYPLFPVSDQYNFISRPTDASASTYEKVDYFGTNSFRFLYENLNYLSNGLVDEEVALSCGDFIPLDICNDCINFQLENGEEYILSAWVKEEQNLQVKTYENPEIHISFKDINGNFIGGLQVCSTKGDIIDGWQRIFKTFIVPNSNPAPAFINIELVNKSSSIPVYFDDIRVHPKDGSMKSFVYDPETFRLMSELDENNYSTFYEYDKEGGLIRVKKETSRGVKTIQETRSGNVIIPNN